MNARGRRIKGWFTNLFEQGMPPTEAELRREAKRAELVSSTLDPETVEAYLDLNEALASATSGEQQALMANFLWSKDVVPLDVFETFKHQPRLAIESRDWLTSSESGVKTEKVPIVDPSNAREYEFNEPEGHKPLAPRSALYCPPRVRFTTAEKMAQDLPKLFEGLTPTPAFKKKLKADKESKNIRRVWFDAKGKMHDVK